MPRYDHLQLVRLPQRFERRRHGGGGPPPPREPVIHSTKLRTELDVAVDIQQRRRPPEFVDPSLILRVQMTGALLEDQWEQLGLTVLSSDADRTLVLFSSADDMQDFRARLDAYQGGPPAGQINAPYNGFVGTIETIGAIEPRDRIGLRFREDGFVEPTDFHPQSTYIVDLELWDLGERRVRERKLAQVVNYVETQNGEIFDQYIGPAISMVRVRLSGSLLQTLLTIEDVASIDRKSVV